MTKAELLDHIRGDRAALDALVVSVEAQRLVDHRDASGWCAKDHLAHIAVWERILVAHLNDRSGHVAAGLDYATFAAMGLEELNARLHEMRRNETPDAALDEYRRAHAAVVACIEQMPESRYDQPFWGDDPPPQKTVIEKIAGDTHDHYREHAEWIADILQEKAKAT